MSKLYSIEDFKKYIGSCDSFGDVVYNLTEAKMDKAIEDYNYQSIRNELMEEKGYDQEDMDLECIEDEVNGEAEEIYHMRYGKKYMDL